MCVYVCLFSHSTLNCARSQVCSAVQGSARCYFVCCVSPLKARGEAKLCVGNCNCHSEQKQKQKREHVLAQDKLQSIGLCERAHTHDAHALLGPNKSGRSNGERVALLSARKQPTQASSSVSRLLLLLLLEIASIHPSRARAETQTGCAHSAMHSHQQTRSR